MFKPDPSSTLAVTELDRFNKDFSKADQTTRAY